MTDAKKLLASYVAQHGHRRVSRALYLAALNLTQMALERAEALHEERGRQWVRAQEQHYQGYERELGEWADRNRPEPAPQPPPWTPTMWGTLRRFATAGQNFAIWRQRRDDMVERLAPDIDEARRERAVSEWRGGFFDKDKD